MNSTAGTITEVRSDKPQTTPLRLDENLHLNSLGERIRTLRGEQKLTLQAIAERTGLSPSMISMVERGRTSPSIGTLVAISSALGVRVGELFDFEHRDDLNPVQRLDDQVTFATVTGVVHRAAVVALAKGLGVNVNEYSVGASSAEEKLHHTGFECGVVLEGVLKVELGEESHILETGDSIAYESSVPHRISNVGNDTARAVWVNIDR